MMAIHDTLTKALQAAEDAYKKLDAATTEGEKAQYELEGVLHRADEMATELRQYGEQAAVEIQQEIDRAGQVYQENKKNNSPPESLAYDEGRRRGLIDALEILKERR